MFSGNVRTSIRSQVRFCSTEGVDEGGLGLHHLKSKALANLISTLIHTAKNTRFQSSLFHSWLYSYHVEADTSLPNPGFTPYYDAEFFDIFKKIKNNTPLNPIHMDVKEWYRVLVEKNVTKHEIDDEGRMELVP